MTRRHRQGALLPMEKFREILRLHELGYSQGQIAHSCMVARSTVQDYVRRATAKGLTCAQLKGLSDSEAKQRLGKGKRERVNRKEEIDFAPIQRELKCKGVTLSLLWQEGLNDEKWNCSYASFCRRYRQWKGSKNLSMRQEHKVGEKMSVDYCGMTVTVYDPITQEETEAQIFVAVLTASNYTFAEATPSQALPHWLGSHQRALEFFGGVPKIIVPDNLKSGVTDPCWYEPGINRSYQDFAEHYGLAVIPARPKKPRDKPKVEKGVQEVERQILAPLRHERFVSFAQLNEAISKGVKRLNTRQMRSYGMSRLELFEEVEREALAPLPKRPFTFARWKDAKVSLDYHIEFERHYYSVPFCWVGHRVRVKATEHQLEIFHDNQRVACHERSRKPHRHTTLPQHMPPKHWAYKQRSKQTFLAWAKGIGPDTVAQVEAIFALKDHEEQAFRTLMGVQRLAKQYGKETFETACAYANHFSLVGFQRLRSTLENNRTLPSDPPSIDAVPTNSHDNLRGQAYYQ